MDDNSDTNNVSVDEDVQSDNNSEVTKKKTKRGIIYLSTIPPYMNVTRIREVFEQYGTLGRVYMQLAETARKSGEAPKSKKKKIAKKFTEGWVEFERKSVAKKVATLLNNKQVSTRKKSKQYDCMWNIKYLSGFKWTHLHERLAYEKASRRQKIRAEVQLAKKQTNFFTNNIDKRKKKKDFVNKQLVDVTKVENKKAEVVEDDHNPEERKQFLKSLFTS